MGQKSTGHSENHNWTNKEGLSENFMKGGRLEGDAPKALKTYFLEGVKRSKKGGGVEGARYPGQQLNTEWRSQFQMTAALARGRKNILSGSCIKKKLHVVSGKGNRGKEHKCVAEA